jgi:flagellar biosynthesis protein FlhG
MIEPSVFHQQEHILNAARPDLAARNAQARRTQRGAAPVFAITSGKGGVGKTNVVANLSVLLKRKKKRLLAIDADLGLANLDLFLGVKPVYTLADFFTGLVPLTEVITYNSDGIALLPGASGVQEITSLRHEQKMTLLAELDALANELDLVLVDTGSGISDSVTYFISAAQEIVVVVNPEPSSMTDAYALMKVLSATHHEKRFWILPNNVNNETEARRIFDTLSRTALRFLNASVDFMGWIPRDADLLRAVARSETVVSAKPDSIAARAFDSVAERLLQIADKETKVKGTLQFFFRRMLEGGRAE